MALKHYDAVISIKFMGQHPGNIVADIDWDDTGNGPVTGTAEMKMLKTFRYPIVEGSNGSYNEDGSFHVTAYLKSQFGNGNIVCDLDVAPDGSIVGQIPLLKGIILTFTGYLRNDP